MKFIAYAAGRSARANNLQRVVPECWQPYCDAWLAGYDGKARPQ